MAWLLGLGIGAGVLALAFWAWVRRGRHAQDLGTISDQWRSAQRMKAGEFADR